MTNKFCYPLFRTFVVFIVFFVTMHGCSKEKTDNAFFLQHLKEGDIVFRRGIGTKTRLVLRADTASLYSHVGIVVQTDSTVMIVHITPDEREKDETEDIVKLDAPSVFFASDRAAKGAIARFPDSLICAKIASKYALQLYKRGILFDHNYNLEDSTKMYCSELVWRAYLQGAYDITQGRRSEIKNFPLFSGKYIFPSDIIKNENLSIVYEF